MTAVNGAPTTIAGLPSITSSLTGAEFLPMDLTLGGPTQKATLDEIAAYINTTSGVPASRTINTIDSLSGGGTLAGDLTLTLVNDVGSPGAYMYYGTDPTGIRGWQLNTTLPANATFLQTYAISSTAPSDGDVLVWVAGDNQWEPQPTVPGGGDVVGPASATDGHLAVFDGATGKLIKDGGPVPTGGVTSIATNNGVTGGTITTTGTIGLATIADQRVMANISGGTAIPTANTTSAILDATLGSTQGQILYRGASAWAVLSAGTSGQFLETLGAGQNPVWAFPGGGVNTQPTLRQYYPVRTGAATAYPVNVVSGNILIVCLGWYNGGATTTSISDSLGTSYTKVQELVSGSNDIGASIFVGAAPSSGANTVTPTFPGGSSFTGITLVEYQNLTTTIDDSAVARGTGFGLISLTTVTDGCLIFSYSESDSNTGTFVTPSGFLDLYRVGNSDACQSFTYVQPKSGYINPTGPTSGNNNTIAMAIAIRP